jgi:hypothetical protein
MRHTFASFAIAAGVPTFDIAKDMGTSIELIDSTYAHLLPDSEAPARGRQGEVTIPKGSVTRPSAGAH